MSKAMGRFGEPIIKNKELRGLKSIFQKWVEFTEKYCRRYPDDAPYWYNERANVSLLAAAIWSSGGMALEEYGSDKKWEKEGYLGRTDLWFQHGRSDYLVEAKVAWVTLSSEEKPVAKEIARQLREAIREARSNFGETEPHAKLAVVFVVPKVQQQDKKNIEKYLDRLLAIAVATKQECHALVPCFPPSARNLEDEGHVWPGALMLVRRA